MKKIAAAFAFLMMATVVFAEYESLLRYEEFYRNGQTSYYCYDNESDDYYYEAEYDENGNMTSEYTQDGISCWYGDYTYSDSGILLSEKITRPYVGYVYVTETRYNEMGNQVYYKSGNLRGDDYTSYHEQIYEYDDEGRLIFSRTVDNEGSHSYWDETTYSYDRNGNILSDKYTDSDGYTRESIYRYDSAGNPIYGKLTTPEQTIEARITYDERGNMLERLYYENDELQIMEKYRYDRCGRETYSKQMYSSGDFIETKAMYDRDGFLLYSEKSDSYDGTVEQMKINVAYAGNRTYIKATKDGETAFYTLNENYEEIGYYDQSLLTASADDDYGWSNFNYDVDHGLNVDQATYYDYFYDLIGYPTGIPAEGLETEYEYGYDSDYYDYYDDYGYDDYDYGYYDDYYYDDYDDSDDDWLVQWYEETYGTSTDSYRYEYTYYEDGSVESKSTYYTYKD